ncbi:MAG: hypothetical protein V8T36_11325 [Ruthenibacterium lactatiformans]
MPQKRLGQRSFCSKKDTTSKSGPAPSSPEKPHLYQMPLLRHYGGSAGAGAFSDGKYVISTEYGGWLPDFLPPEEVLDYIEQADGILQHFGAPAERFMPYDELKKKCLEYDLHMSQAQLKHLGTDANFETMRKMAAFLKEHVTILTDTDVTDVDKAATYCAL